MASSDYVTTNEFVPSSVSTLTEGRSTTPRLTLDTLLLSERNYSSLMKRHAYERLNASGAALSNPPFDMGAAGRLTTYIESTGTDDPRILRGYIRRSNMSGVDPTDGYRLYFMFNPQTIQRSYVAYLDQQALDPFNTIYGSNNLVAPPGILDFSFELFFDRQAENANGTMPRGVLEDFDYFDLVVRGVIPDAGANQIQDNGIMMVNPRNITVVFSPQLSVQGRPYSASVSYEKFDHNMRPVRMTIRLSMKAFYFGPVRPDFSFEATQSNDVYAATIPYDESITYTASYEEIRAAQLKLINYTEGLTDGGEVENPGSLGGQLKRISDISSAPNVLIRETALQNAESLSGQGVTYTHQRPAVNPGAGLDCSGLVIWAYRAAGAIDALGQPDNGYGYTVSLMEAAGRLGTYVAGPGTFSPLGLEFLSTELKRGDLLISKEHVAFVSEVMDGKVKTFESTPYYNGPRYIEFSYGALLGNPNYHTHVIRPAIAGNDTFGNLGLTV